MVTRMPRMSQSLWPLRLQELLHLLDGAVCSERPRRCRSAQRSPTSASRSGMLRSVKMPGLDGATFQFLPCARRRHRRAALRPNRVRRGKRRAVAVPAGVDVDAAAVDQSWLNSCVSVSGARRTKSAPTAVANRAAAPMVVLPSSGTTMWKPFEPVVLTHDGQAELLQQIAQADRCRPHLGGVVAGRIEIEHAEVRASRGPAAATSTRAA